MATWHDSEVRLTAGNTVYVGLGITGQPYSQPTRWIKSGTSILTFLVGSFLFSRLMTYLTPRSRSALLTSSILQTICTIIPAILSSTGLVPANAGDLLPRSFIVLLPLSLLAIQSGGQCVLSRVLGYSEIPTVVLTSAYCDIGMDPKLFAGPTNNVKRNRRVGSAVLLILGAWIGGYLTRHGHIGQALWVVSGVKAAMALVWVVWPRPKGVQLE